MEIDIKEWLVKVSFAVFLCLHCGWFIYSPFLLNYLAGRFNNVPFSHSTWLMFLILLLNKLNYLTVLCRSKPLDKKKFNCCTSPYNRVLSILSVLLIFLGTIKSSYLVKLGHSSPRCRWTNVNCEDLIVPKNITID